MRLSRFGEAALVSVLLASISLGQSIDNKGTEFVLAFMPNYLQGAAPQGVELHLACAVATNVLVEYPVNAPTFSQVVPVNPGAVSIVALPLASAYAWAPNAANNNCVRASAAQEFVCYMINRMDYTSDAALGLPVDTMNTEYIVADYTTISPSYASTFVVYAAYDSTTVEITPSQAITGHAAGIAFAVTLNRGQGYFARATAGGATLTGTTISASRPVGLTNGTGCTNIPVNYPYCDHIFEVGQPLQTWGMSIAVANLPNRPGGSIYRVLGSQDGTNVLLDGAPFGGVLNRGAFFESAALSGNHLFEADKPIYVIQYMTGQTYPGAILGDPSMGNMIPTAQFQDGYTFSTVGGGQFVQNYLTIIALNLDVGLLEVDGIPVPAALFSPIGISGYSAAVLPLTSGSHTTASPNGHGITVEGYNNYDSYLYPGGALFQFINPVGDENDPVCTISYSGAQPPTASIVATDNRPSEDVNNNHVLDPGEDLNANDKIDKDTGIFFVAIEPGSTNLQINVAPFIPGDPSVTITASMIDTNVDATGSVRVTDGAGNTCVVPVELIANQDPVITCNGTVTLWQPDHGLVDVQSAFVVSDPDNDPLTVTIDMYSDEPETPETGDGTGRHAPDFKNETTIVGGRGLLLRSERRGPENGRWYVAVITADDGRGGRVKVACLVAVVPHDQNATSQAMVIAEGQAARSTIAAAVAADLPLPITGTHRHGVAAALGPNQ